MSEASAASPQSLSSRTRRTLWALVAGLGLGAGLALFLLLRGPWIEAQLVRAARADLVVPVLCSGRLEPPPGGELRARDGGTVAAILVSDGQRVRRGALLLRIDSPEVAVAAIEARAEVARVREERAAAEAEAEREEKEVAYREEVVAADARLVEQGAVTRATQEADALAHQQAAARLRAARARLASLGGSAGAASRLALSEAKARDLEERVAALSIRAPRDGVAYGLPRRVGEPVSPGQVLANVTDPQRPHVRGLVEEPDLPRVAVGQPLIVTFDGLPDRRWEGRLESVMPGLRDAGGRDVGEVLGTIADPERLLPMNASLDLRIVVGERRAALVIPRAALQREGARRFVFVAEDGRARRREVSLGLVGTNEVEVVSGLDEGELVAVPAAVPLRDGARLRPGP